jgi:hypothetical protein
MKIEVNSRLDFLWRTKFKKEMDEVEVTSTISQLLLENMLPKHVVGIILDPKRNKDVVFLIVITTIKILEFLYSFILF